MKLARCDTEVEYCLLYDVVVVRRVCGEPYLFEQTSDGVIIARQVCSANIRSLRYVDCWVIYSADSSPREL